MQRVSDNSNVVEHYFEIENRPSMPALSEFSSESFRRPYISFGMSALLSVLQSARLVNGNPIENKIIKLTSILLTVKYWTIFSLLFCQG